MVAFIHVAIAIMPGCRVKKQISRGQCDDFCNVLQGDIDSTT